MQSYLLPYNLNESNATAGWALGTLSSVIGDALAANLTVQALSLTQDAQMMVTLSGALSAETVLSYADTVRVV